MGKKKTDKERPLVSMDREEREEVWDDLYVKEEGVILKFDPESNTGALRSLSDGSVHQIDSREQLRTKSELRPGDRVLFAPIEDADGTGFARVVRIIELST
jgi:hypothetical protein